MITYVEDCINERERREDLAKHHHKIIEILVRTPRLKENFFL